MGPECRHAENFIRRGLRSLHRSNRASVIPRLQPHLALPRLARVGGEGDLARTRVRPLQLAPTRWAGTRMRLETERLILRGWVAEDLEPFAAMSADPRVMRWLGGCLSRQEAESYVARATASFADQGMGRFAVERRSDGAFVGACGLMPGPCGPAHRPLCRYRLATGSHRLGRRLCDRGRGGGVARRVRAAGACGDRRHHHAVERPVAGGDGAPWHDPRRGQRLRRSRADPRARTRAPSSIG